MTAVANLELAGEPRRRVGQGYWAGVLLRLARDPVAVAAAAVILAFVLAAIFAPWLAPADPYRGAMLRRLRPIGDVAFPLGSDELGRDMLSRLIFGGRLSLLIGLVPVALAFLVGSAIGIVAGYVGGWLNMAIMRVIDVFFAFPSVLLAARKAGERLAAIPGSPPDLADLPPGCTFAPRCALAEARCAVALPGEVTIGEAHWARCIRAKPAAA